jgi:hypothetical protein
MFIIVVCKGIWLEWLLLLFLCATSPMASGQMAWTQLFDTLTYKMNIKPTPRREASIAYDRERNRVILFGGCQQQHLDDLAPVVFDDTWEFNLYTCTCQTLFVRLIYPYTVKETFLIDRHVA